MRIAGTFLLIGGLVLCISIVWAAPGFLMMGFGLICLQTAERRKRPPRPAVSRADKIAARQEPSLFPIEAAQSAGSVTPSGEIKTRPEPSRREDKRANPAGRASGLNQTDARREHARFRGRKDARPKTSTATRTGHVDLQDEPARFRRSEEPKFALAGSEEQTDRRHSAFDAHSHDAKKWSLLVENDADIARATAALAPFGQKYVDELAKTYLVLNAKEYLPIIFKKVAASARRDLGKDSASAVAAESSANTDLISFALGETQNLRLERAFDVRTGDSLTEEAGPLNNAPNLMRDTKQKHASLQPAPSRGRPERGMIAVEGTDTMRTVKVATVFPARPDTTAAMGPDDLEDLTDLLNRFEVVDARTSAKR